LDLCIDIGVRNVEANEPAFRNGALRDTKCVHLLFCEHHALYKPAALGAPLMLLISKAMLQNIVIRSALEHLGIDDVALPVKWSGTVLLQRDIGPTENQLCRDLVARLTGSHAEVTHDSIPFRIIAPVSDFARTL